ncbi:short-chain alcohol dehydrogenase [Scheffersomyces xylosifermentans]|uniref:short-chain alcohol dehydrogenase n=1 Tax=Scheffersomyces xylosifermentans TaxID=1304137 RepID=UPI00315DF74B
MSLPPPAVPRLNWAAYKQFFNGFFPGKAAYTEEKYPSLDGKVVIVTGGNTGVGYQTAKSLAGSTNAKVYIFSRSAEKTLAAIKKMELEVAKEYNRPKINVHFIQVDLSDLTTIKPAVEKFLAQEKRLDIVIHNAGVMTPPRGSETKQGYELQFGTNNVGTHLLQRLLDPIFIETSKTNKPGESRVVWVASSAQFNAPLGGVNWNDVNFKNTKFSDMGIYGQSKAVNVMQARAWPKYHPTATNVLSFSLCPGFLRTDLQRHLSSVSQWLMGWILHDQRNGAYTELFAALSPDLTKANQGEHMISFGKLGHTREDLTIQANVDKVWEFLDKETEPYL